MKKYTTIIQAIDPVDGVLKTWAGPRIPANTLNEAKQYVQNNGMGYCKVIGVFVAEVHHESDN